LKLTKHFSLSEAVKSQTAERHFIDNSLPDEYLPKVIAVAENILEPVRLHFGVPFTPSSWYRSKELCLKIGSKTTSQHALAEAVDFEVSGVDNLTLAKWCEYNLEFDKLILEFYTDEDPASGWVHASYRENNNRHEVYTISRVNGAVITQKDLP
tara:strand:+ start:561 stop:1022 length:462 start_codon:yes stop_codon:yes gene_type:complete